MSNKKSFYDIAKKLEEADENKWYLVWIRCGAFFVAIESSAIILSYVESSEEITQFKAFFNEWFLRDTSKKIRNGKKTRAKEGKVMTTYPTYWI